MNSTLRTGNMPRDILAARIHRGRRGRPMAAMILALGLGLGTHDIAHAQEAPPPASVEIPRGARIVGHDDQGPIVEFTPEEMEAREAVGAFEDLHAEKREKERGPSPYALVNDADPEGTVPLGLQQTNPMAFAYYFMELSGKAEEAATAGEYEKAIKFQRAIVKAAPEIALGYRSLCVSYSKLGRAADAEEACHLALSGEGVVIEDATKYVDVALGETGSVSPTVRERVEAVVAHLQGQGLEVIAAQLSCRLATRLESAQLLEPCVTTLSRLAPDDPVTITYSWALAMAKQDIEAAKGIAKRAEQLQLPEAVVTQMREFVAAHSGLPKAAWIGIGAGALGLLSGVAFFKRFRKKGRGMTTATA